MLRDVPDELLHLGRRLLQVHRHPVAHLDVDLVQVGISLEKENTMVNEIVIEGEIWEQHGKREE